jgi:hypothetical protein
VKFFKCDLQKTEFTGTDLSDAKFSTCVLAPSSFERADLTRVEFLNCCITGASFSDADLSFTTFSDCTFEGRLRLLRTRLDGTKFEDLDIAAIDVCYVEWPNKDYTLGEELEADKLLATNRREAERLYAKGETVYRRLADVYRKNGYFREYGRLRFRAYEVRRKLLALQNSPTSKWELRWLEALQYASQYDTNAKRLLHLFVLSVIFFWGIHIAGWLLLRRKWIRIFVLDDNGERLKKRTSFRYAEHSWSSVKHLRRSLKRALLIPAITLLISLEGSLFFLEKPLKALGASHFYRFFDMEPAAVQAGRIALGVQALLTLFLFVFAGRVLIVMGINP